MWYRINHKSELFQAHLPAARPLKYFCKTIQCPFLLEPLLTSLALSEDFQLQSCLTLKELWCLTLWAIAFCSSQILPWLNTLIFWQATPEAYVIPCQAYLYRWPIFPQIRELSSPIFKESTPLGYPKLVSNEHIPRNRAPYGECSNYGHSLCYANSVPLQR